MKVFVQLVKAYAMNVDLIITLPITYNFNFYEDFCLHSWFKVIFAFVDHPSYWVELFN